MTESLLDRVDDHHSSRSSNYFFSRIFPRPCFSLSCPIRVLSPCLQFGLTEGKVFSLRTWSVNSSGCPLFPPASLPAQPPVGPVGLDLVAASSIPGAEGLICRQNISVSPESLSIWLGPSYHDDVSKLLLQEPFQLPPAEHHAVALRPGVALEGIDDPADVSQ